MQNNNNNTNSNNEWSKRDMGALWKREGKSQKYLSGYVKFDEFGVEREVKIVVFSNKSKKDNAKAPDYRIYLSTPVEENKTSKSTVQNKKATPAKQQVVEESEDIL
jgi:hypothetical protein